MITIQEVHKYLKLVEIGMARPILCPVDNDHLPMISNIDDKDNVYFSCLACNTKVHPGDNLIKKIKLVTSTL